MASDELSPQVVQTILDNCEENGACAGREGPWGWCDSCIALHLAASDNASSGDAS